MAVTVVDLDRGYTRAMTLVNSMRTLRSAVPAIALLLVGVFLLPGCGSADGPRSLVIAPGGYARALDATRETLRAAGYTVERVDAVAGEVSTGQKTVAGIATPLTSENRSIDGVLADTLGNRPRTVRVRFRDANDPESEPSADRAVRLEVDALIWRAIHPNKRVETETAFGNLVWIDPQLARRGVTTKTPIPVSRDDRFAAAVVRRIASRLDEADIVADQQR